MIRDLWPYLAALIPFIGGALIFYVIIRNVMRGDHNEREARRQWAAEHPGSRVRPQSGSSTSGPTLTTAAQEAGESSVAAESGSGLNPGGTDQTEPGA